MAAQKGKDLLVKIDQTGAGVFATLAGLRATRLAFNAQSVDVTTADSSGQWRELLAGAGLRSAAVTGSGIFKDATSDTTLRRAFFDADTPTLQIVVPDFGTITGSFQVTSLEYAGQHDGEATYEVSLASAGALSFSEA